MLIHSLFIGNALRNFNYLVACPQTGHALLIDPLDANLCLQTAKKHHLTITHVINTHEHWDHIAGNADIFAATNATILCHSKALERIPYAKKGLSGGESISLGSSVSIKVLDTPGHTMSHVCLIASSNENSTKALFSGDTLFNAGCGNCYNGGKISAMFHTLYSQLMALDENITLYPGHDYLENNLRFSLSREPNNQQVKELLEKEIWKMNTSYHTTLKIEKEISPFFRLANPEIRFLLEKEFPHLSKTASLEEVFTCLRALRDNW